MKTKLFVLAFVALANAPLICEEAEEVTQEETTIEVTPAVETPKKEETKPVVTQPAALEFDSEDEEAA